MKYTYLLPLFLFGCSSKGVEDSGDPPTIYQWDDTGTMCEGAEPRLLILSAENGGLQDYEGTQWPTILLQAEAIDDDGDLQVATMELWWDDTPDGMVDTESTAAAENIFSNSEDPCLTKEATLGLYLQVGRGITYDTEYDFAARVTDSTGLQSEVKIVTAFTPKEDGSDGGI
jgi:hypothetical protein